MTSDHSRHDRLLVTRFAMGDAYPTESESARDLVASCTQCAQLAAEIRLIAHATQRLPDARRPRDFRISAQEADRLHGSPFERFMRRVPLPSWTLVRPLAGAGVAVGLALAVIGALPVSLPATAPAPPAFDAGGPASAPSQYEASPASDQESHDTNTTPAPGGYVSAPLTPVSASGGASSPGAEGPTQGEVGPASASSAPSAAASGIRIDTPPAVPQRSSAPVPQPTSAPATAAVAPATAVVGKVAAPSSSPEPGSGVSGTADVATRSEQGSREVLVATGLALAGFALGLAVLTWFARRRYSDPLLR